MDRTARQGIFREVDLYPVTCRELSAGRTDLDIVKAALDGGVRAVQYREKNLDDGDRLRRAEALRHVTAGAGALLVINDRVDIALAAGADGVHLGRKDLPVAAARRLAPDLLIGASTHSLADALESQEAGADYVNIGPIFPTETKEGLQEFLGPEAISAVAPHLKIPFTVMGGIKAGNMHEVLSRGARRIAVVTAVTQAPDIAAEVRRLRAMILSFSR